MKKKVMRLALAVVTVICLTIPFVFVSFAADGKETYEPLSVEQEVEQNGDKLVVTLTVTNNVEGEASSVFDKVRLLNEEPEGYEKRDEESVWPTGGLVFKGKPAVLTTTFVKQESPTPDPTNPDDPTNPTVGPTDPTDPKTGDTNQIVWFIIMFVLAAGLIAALSIRNVRNKLALAFTSAGHSVAKWVKNNYKKFLPILLGFALLGGVLGVTAVKTTAAETDTQNLNTQTITKENSEYGVNVTSSVTFTKETVLPEKEDLITLAGETPEGDDGLTNVYRVLKVDDDNSTQFLVMSMWDVSEKGIPFNTESKKTTFTGTGGDTKTLQQYEESNLDKYLNGNYYDNLDKKIKVAIVPQEIVQNAYYFEHESGDNPEEPRHKPPKWWKGIFSVNDYYYFVDTGYNVKVSNPRKVFALDDKDVMEYLGMEYNKDQSDKLNTNNLRRMFFNTIEPQYDRYCWLRSANTDFEDSAEQVGGGSGQLCNGGYDKSWEARAAFVIDLSNCSWQPWVEPTPTVEAAAEAVAKPIAKVNTEVAIVQAAEVAKVPSSKR